MKKLKYAIMAAAVLGFSACTNEDDVTGGNYVTDPDAVVVSASIGAPLTRANTEGAGDQFSENDIIYVENTGTGKIAGKAKGYYRLSTNGTWTPCDVDGNDNPTQYIVWGNDGSNDFQGIYPATASETFTLPINQSTLELLRSADYMVGAPKTGTDATTKPTDRTLNLTFTHQLAKVTVALVFNDQYTGNETINGMNFYLTDGTTPISAYAHNITEGSTTQKAYTAILNPGSYTNTGNTFCTINVDGTDLIVKVPAKGITLTGGMAHTLTLYVGKDKINFGGMIVNDWGTTQPLDDNVADEQPTVNTTTHTITTYMAGQIADYSELITTAMGTEGILKVVGPMNQADMDAISANKATITELDLSGATGEIAITFQAFLRSTSLTKVKLGSNVTSIAYNAFAGCTSLQEVDLSACSNLTLIGASAFTGCNNITTLKLPVNGKLETIKMMAFMDCDNIKSITFPETLKQIGNWMFNETNIETLVFLSQDPPLVAIDDYVTDPGDFTDLFYVSNKMSNVTIYLPNVQREDADAKGWTTFFVNETNYSGVKYGESPATVNP